MGGTGGGGSSDPAVRFAQQMVSDFTGARGARSPRRAAGGSDPHRSTTFRFVPVTPVAGAITVLAVEADQISPWLTSTVGELPGVADVASLLDGLSAWQVAAVTATLGAIAVDTLRWYGFRHRRAVTNIVSATTQLTPKRVRVRQPAGIAAPRRVVVSLTDGSVISDLRYAALVDALTKYANRYRGDSLAHQVLRSRVWDIEVDWQAGSARLVITRNDPDAEAKDFTDRHKRLVALLGEKFPLPEARITDISRDDDGDEVGYTISYAPSISAALPGFQQRLREALIGSLPEHESGRMWTVAVHSDVDEIVIGLAQPLPARVEHLPLPLEDYVGLDAKLRWRIPFATAADEVTAVWNIANSSSAPHILIAGKTGGGKTSLIRTLLTEAIPRGVPVAGAIDPKMIELDGFDTFPGVAAVVFHVREIVALINAVHAEMLARQQFVHRTKIPPSDLPMYLMVMDEFFVMGGFLRRAAGYKGDDDELVTLAAFVKNSDPFGKIGEILALIRSSNGRIIMGVQRPDAKNFGPDAGSVRDNFGARVSLSNLSMDGAQMMWDDAHAGRDVDTSVPGRATVADDKGQPMHAQVHWTPDVDDHPNKVRRLSPEDRAIVTALREAAAAGHATQQFTPEVQAELARTGGAIPTPGGGPVMACFSEEMREFLLSHQSGEPLAPEPVGGLDPVTAGDEGVRASELTEGMRIHIDDAGAIATVAALTVTKTRVLATLRDETSPSRVAIKADYEPDELVLTADPVEPPVPA